MRRAKRSDLGISLGVGFLIGAGPLSSPNLGLSLILGVAAAGLLLSWRLQYLPETRAARPARWQVPSILWGLGALYAVAAWPTLAWMYEEWTGSVFHNTHGMLMPVLMVLLGRNILRRMPERPEEASPWGFAFLLPGLALMALDAGAQTRFLSAVGFVVTLPGLSLLVLGAHRTRALALPLVLGIFMVPLPPALASDLYLRLITADAVGWILNSVGISTFVGYSILELPNATFIVGDECSGFSTLYSSVAMAVLLGSLCPSVARRYAIYGLVLPLALAANVVRVLALVLISLYIDPGLLDTSMHSASGVASFLLVVLGFLSIADRPSLAKALF